MDILIGPKLKLYPLWHRFVCKYNGNLEILVPNQEYMKESGDNEAYMLCPECNKKYHLCYLEPDD